MTICSGTRTKSFAAPMPIWNSLHTRQAHDLQEPLRQVAIYSELLAKKYASKLDGKAAGYLAYCIEGAHRMEMLISDLLAYCHTARTADSPQESVSVGDVIDTVRKNLSATIEETAAEIRTSNLPVVFADSVPLVHLFQNLVSNALKYRSERKPLVTIAATQNAGQWLFSVEDNGIGIAKEFQTQIFGIFKRLHDRAAYPGTGIGLAICQKIVERHGGRIWVESVPGRGSTFFFTLPGAVMNNKRPQVILVEDNPADADLVEEALNEASVDCGLSVVRDGLKAIELIALIDADPVPPTRRCS